MGTVTLPKLNQSGTNEWADVEDNDKALRDEINGNIENVNIKSSAAIAHSKLANITAGSVLLGNASNVPTATALSGDVTVNSSGVTTLAAVTAAKISLGSVSTDDSSAVTNMLPSTWTTTSTTLTAASTGLYLITCEGHITDNSATSATVTVGSRLLVGITPLQQQLYQLPIVASGNTWPFQHVKLASLTAADIVSHQAYSTSPGSDVASGGFTLSMIRLSA